MEKLLNDQQLTTIDLKQSDQLNDILVKTNEDLIEHESEIENGNVKDYVDIFGDWEEN